MYKKFVYTVNVFLDLMADTEDTFRDSIEHLQISTDGANVLLVTGGDENIKPEIKGIFISRILC